MQTLNKLRLAARTLVLLTLSMLGATNIYGAPGDVLETLTISNSEATGVPSPTGYQGIATYNGYLWVVDVWSDRIYRVYPETVFDEDEVTVLNNPGDSDFNIPIPDNIPNGLPFCDNQATCRGGGSLTFARNFFWNASPVTDDIVKLDPVDGDNLETENTLDTMPFPSPLGMTFDGTHFWIVDWQSNTINKVLPEDGSVIDTIPGPSTLPACGSQPYDNVQFCARPFGIAWDGIALWVTEREEQRIYRINPANGDILTYLENPSFLNDPLGLAWDGQFLWVTNRDNDSASSIHKVDSGITPFGIMGCVEKNGIGIDGDVLLSQAAQSDQSTATDRDGCFLFADFASGVPLSVEISESGNDKKPILTLVGEDVTLIVGDSYSDPGVIATDEEDGDISSSVTAVPDILNVPTLIDTSVPGPAEGTLITYNVIDSAGNAADPITRTVYVLEVDVIPPVITLNGDNPLYVEQGSSYTEPGAVAIDARDGDISNNLTITGSVNSAVAGTYSLDYDVTDATGNTAITVTRTVVVQDTTKPSITLLGTSPLTLEKGDTYIESGATATDNIDGDISGSVAIAGSVSTNLTGTYVLTYNVSDVAGNAATTVTRTVQVQDTTAPEITLFGATDIDHELEQPFSDPGYSASDVPGEDLTGSVIITGSVDPDTTGIYTLTYNVTDAAGNAAVAQTRTINVADRTAPVLSIIGDNPLEHELGAAYTEQGATAIDAIDGDLSGAIAIAGDTVDGFLTGTYIVTYDIADAAGNAAPTQTRTVNVADTTPPLVTLLGSPIVEHELGTVYTDAGATASDNIDGDLTGIITVGGDTVNTNVAGDYILTYSVVDASGNPSSVVTRLVQVADRTIPTITILGDNPLQHEVATIFNDPGATANDNIDNDITSRIGVTGSVNAGLVGSYTLTYNVTDLSGNAATTVTRTVNVVDTGTPTITLLGDNPILHELQTPFTDPGATASDDADGDLGSVTATGSVDENTAGTYTLTYDISDSQGNPAPTLTRTVIVADRTAPVISLNGAATVQHEQGTAYTDSGATAVDIIDGDLTLAINESGTVDSNTQGTYILTYDVSDAAGNAATQVTRTVNVVDTTIPVITLLGSDPVDHEVGTVYTDAGATASDNIDGVITGNIGVTGSVNASVIGTYSLTYNVQDSSGNAAATVTRTVNVVDTGAPTITLLGSNPILHELQTPFTDPGATASDAADGDLSGSIVPTGAVDPNVAGTYTLTYNVTDSQSNAAPTVTRDVIVADRTAPVITLNGAATVQHEQGTTYTDLGAAATDIIDDNATLTSAILVSGSVNDAVAGTYALTYDVSDAAGNAATQVTRTVNVVDTTIPVITLLGSDPVDHEVGTVYTDAGATASDNIDGVITGNIGVTGSVNASVIGTYSLTYNVQDSSGNAAATVTRTVNVVDTGAPTITLLGSNPILHELQTPFTDPGATASDAADGDLSGSIVPTGAVDPNVAGTYTLTYNVTDSQSNAAPTVTRDVIVADRTAPVITLNGAATVQHEQGTTYTDLGAAATDIIDDNATLTSAILVSGSVNDAVAGTYALTYDVSDATGNAATQVTRTVNVVDTTIPVITLLGSDPVDHEVGTVYTDAGATASDNIDGVITGNIGVTGSVNASVIGTYSLTYNVQDSSGNAAATVTRTVNVVDTGAPTITLLGSNPILHELQTPFTDPGATASDAADGDLSGSIVPTGAVDPNVAGTYTLTYNVTDSQSNAAPTVTRDVIVADRTAPVITLNGAATVQHEQGTTYTDLGAAATDIIDDNATLTSAILVSGSVNDAVAGTYALTYDVSDATGNAATQVTRTVNVVDTTIPVITLLGSDPVDHEVGTVYTDAGATASDNIDGVITGNIGVTGSVNASVIGTYSLTYNVQDSSGNAAATVTRTVNVVDTGAPTITLLGSNPILHELQTPFTDPGATASDAADGDLSGSIVPTGAVDPNVAGTYTLTYNVTDSQSNAAPTVTRDVIVADRTAPVITLNGAATVQHEQGTTYTDLGAAATDVIDGSVTVNVANAVNQSTAGSYTVTYNAVDAAGNAATPVVRTVIVSDTTAPTITITGASPQTHEFGAVFVDEGATASDNIDGDISSRIGASGSVNPNALGTYFISYNVTDLSGNAAATATRTVEVVDTGAPVITVNGANPLYHELNTPFTDPGASATDAVDPSVTVITSGDTVDANTAGTYTILYDAQDQDLNDANQRSRTVIVGDFTAPVISLNGDSTITHEQLTPYVDLGATATDNIDGDMGNVPSTGSVASNTAGTYLLSYDISDAAGNDAVTVVRTVIVEDTTPPSLSLSGLATVNHEQGTPYVDPGATASDNLDGNLTSNIVVSNPVNSGLAGTYTVSYNVTDAAGNPASTLTRTVIVADTAAPTININGATSINHEQGTAYVDAGATASDLVDGSLTSSISTVNNVNSAAAGSYTVTYNVSDAAGNAASTATRTVVVADTTAPIILRTGPATVNVEQGTSYTDQGATATDTVDGVLTGSIATVNPVNVNVAGSYSVTYDVSDAANNAASQVTRTVIVADTTPPVITLVGAPTVNIEQGDTYNDAGATASDSVDGPLTGSISTNNPVNTNIPGTYTVTYNVSDVAGNFAAQVTRTVIVADTTPPAISLIGSSTVNVEQGTSYSDAGATASDSVDGVITANITVSGDTVDPATAGSYVIRYDVTDAAGNAAPQVTRTIIVADTTPPLITLAGSALVNHEQGTAYSDSGATANDTVDGSVSITVGGDTVNSAVAGTYTITFDAVDAAGNNATQVTRTVIVADTMAPLISLTGLANIDLERGDSYVEDGATATDSVDGAVAVNIGGDTVDGNTPGTYTVTYNAVDAAGNNATQVTRTVSVADTIPPSITLTGLANVTHEQGAVYSDAGATANDSYDGNLSGSIIATGVNFDVNTAGVYIIEYNVQDSSGNAAAPVTRTVTVEDNTAPVITRTGSATVTVERGNSYTDAGATATDNIDGDLTGSVVTTGSVNTLVAGNYTITYNVSDTSGNAGTPVQRTVTVEDTSIPTITLAGSANVNHEQGTSYTDAGATAQDLPGENISGSIVVSGSVDSNTAGIYVLTFNVSDIAGNAANSVTRSVNVADTTAPVITLNGASTINVEQGTSYTDAGASATDLVDGSVTVTVGGDTVDPATAGTYIITYDAIDAATNSAIQVTRTVIVADTTVPVITLTGDTNIDIALGDLFVDPGYSASDNIDGDLSSSVSPTGNVDINTEGTYILSYDVSDTAGNSAVTQTRTVNVVTPVTISFEAETATISGAHTVASTNTGFTGSGYIEHSGEGFVEYTFNAFELPYDLVVRYAWDSGDRPLEVILNGQSLGTLSFPATGSLTTWLDTASFALTPQSGSNTLRLETTGSSGANLDSISLTPQ